MDSRRRATTDLPRERHVRAATAADAATVCALVHAAFAGTSHPPSGAMRETPASVARALADGEEAALAEVDGRPVAAVRFTTPEGALRFSRLSVPPDERGRGHARALVAHVEALAAARGLGYVSCRVRATETGLRVLYARLGYVETSVEPVRNLDGVDVPAVTMVKRLSSD